MSPIEHVWDALDRHIQPCIPANIQQLRTATEELHCVRQMVVKTDTDWFSFVYIRSLCLRSLSSAHEK